VNLAAVDEPAMPAGVPERPTTGRIRQQSPATPTVAER